MDNKTSEIILYSEDIIKNEIMVFLNLFKSSFLHTDEDFLTIINGGDINNCNTKGFIKLKEAIYNLMKKKCDNNSKALHYIESNRRLRNFNYSSIICGINMYDFQAIRNKMLEYIPNDEKNGIKYIKNNICNYKFNLIDFIDDNK
jgi:hypothetical protein